MLQFITNYHKLTTISIATCAANASSFSVY